MSSVTQAEKKAEQLNYKLFEKLQLLIISVLFTDQPLDQSTSKQSNTAHIVTVQCSAGKTFIITFTLTIPSTYLNILHTSPIHSRPTLHVLCPDLLELLQQHDEDLLTIRWLVIMLWLISKVKVRVSRICNSLNPSNL